MGDSGRGQDAAGAACEQAGALLHTIGDEAPIPKISTCLSSAPPLGRLLDEDFIGVLRTSGGKPGDDLAPALEWLRADS